MCLKPVKSLFKLQIFVIGSALGSQINQLIVLISLLFKSLFISLKSIHYPKEESFSRSFGTKRASNFSLSLSLSLTCACPLPFFTVYVLYFVWTFISLSTTFIPSLQTFTSTMWPFCLFFLFPLF